MRIKLYGLGYPDCASYTPNTSPLVGRKLPRVNTRPSFAGPDSCSRHLAFS